MAKVFISYSRKDKEFVTKLHNALGDRKRETWVDWEGIPPSAKWMAEIEAAIEAAEAFVFVISPDSVISRVCHQEIIHATAQHKKLIPIMFREPPQSVPVPKELAELNYVLCREGADSRLDVEPLIKALDTDLDWVHAHTRLLVRAVEWDSKGRTNSFTLRGSDLKDAERWLGVAGTRKEARPTQLQEQYILASRHAATRRKQTALGLVAFACIVIIALVVIAKDRNQVALSQRLAAEALDHLDDQLDRSLLLSVAAYRIRDTVEARSSLLTALKYGPNLRAFLHSESDSALSVAFNSNGMLASSHKNGSILLWDVTAAQRIRTLKDDSNKAEMWSVAFSPDGRTLASGDNNGKVFLWDLEKGERRPSPLVEFELTVTSLAFSPDGQTLASASEDPGGAIILQNIQNDDRIKLSGHHGNTVMSLAFSPDGKFLASGSKDRTVVLWDIKSSYRKHISFTDHKTEVWAVAFSPDGQLVASGDMDGKIVLRNVASHRPIGRPLTGHKNQINSVAFSPDGRMLASGDASGTILLWNVSTRQRIDLPLTGYRKRVNSIAFSPDGRMLVSGHAEGKILLWDLKANRTLASHHDEIMSIAFSPDGQLLASGSRDGSIALRDMATGQHSTLLHGHSQSVKSVTFTNPDSAALVAGDKDGSIALWNVRTKQYVRTIRARNKDTDVSPAPRSYANGVLVSVPTQNIVLSGSIEGHITIWNTDTDEHCELNEDHSEVNDDRSNEELNSNEVYSIAVSHDGQHLASGRADGTIFTWNIRSVKTGGTFLKHHRKGSYYYLRSIAFSPDGWTLASGSDDGTIMLWDIQHHKPKGALRDSSNAVWALAFSPDGQLLASGNAAGKIILWNVQELRPIGPPLHGHNGGINALVFQPGNQTTLLASGSEDTTVLSWDLPSISEWDYQACRVANRALSKEELPSYDEEARKSFCSPLSSHESKTRVTGIGSRFDRATSTSLSSKWSEYRNLCKMEVPS